MIKVVSTHPVADIGWIGRGRRAKSGGCVTAKRRFGSYPLLNNASCLSSVAIGGREWAQDAGPSHVSNRLPKGADSAVENGEQGEGLAQRLNPFVAFICCH
jgi:hypothetical protein